MSLRPPVWSPWSRWSPILALWRWIRGGGLRRLPLARLSVAVGVLALGGGTWQWWSTRRAPMPLWANTWSLTDIRTIALGVETEDELLVPYMPALQEALGAQMPRLGWRVAPGEADARLLLQAQLVPLAGDRAASDRGGRRPRGLRPVVLRLATWRYATLASREPRLVIIPSWEYQQIVLVPAEDAEASRTILLSAVAQMTDALRLQRPR